MERSVHLQGMKHLHMLKQAHLPDRLLSEKGKGQNSVSNMLGRSQGLGKKCSYGYSCKHLLLSKSVWFLNSDSRGSKQGMLHYWNL